MDKLIFVQDAQQDPETGRLKQSCATPNSISGKWHTFLLKFQHVPFFRWYFESPVVLKPSDQSTGRKDKDRK